MKHYLNKKSGWTGWAVCFFLLSAAGLSALEKTPFTVSDYLRVKNANVGDVTEDGRYVAATVAAYRSRFGIDHRRFGDPTYIAPRLSTLLVLDTEAKETFLPFNKDVHVQSLSWAPDNKKLAVLLLREKRLFLAIYDTETRGRKEMKLKTDKDIASTFDLVWMPDGSRVLLGLRTKEWAEKCRSMFKEAAFGPVIVYDSREPMLKWDVIRNLSGLAVPALVDISSGAVEEILPEDRYSGFRFGDDGSYAVYIVTYPVKTDYEQTSYAGGGREYELFRLDLDGEAEPSTLIERSERRLRLQWNEENSLFAWADKGDIFIQSVDETEARNLTEGKVKAEEEDEAEVKKEKKNETIDKNDKKEETKVRFSLMRFSPDGSKLLASTKKGYWLIDHQSGQLELVYETEIEERGHRGDAQPATLFAWSPEGRYLYFTYSAADKWERGFTRYDLEERRMEELVKDENLYGRPRMSKDGRKFLFHFSDGDMPGDYYQADAEFRNMEQLTDLNPWIDEKKLTRSELIRYLDVDGKELYGILYYPVDYEEGKKYPLVCEIYERFFDNGFRGSANILANEGWFVLRPSVNLEIGYPGESWVKGVTTAINNLIERGLVDPDKLGVHGTSYGGYAASLLITQTDRFAAAVNISGKVNMISFLGDSPRIGHRNYGAAEGGQDRIGATLWEQPFKYINHSAVFFADRIKTPHLLITGDADWNVPAGNTREMYYALRRLGKVCVWVNYYNDGHGLGATSDEEMYADKWKRIIDWYKTYFK